MERFFSPTLFIEHNVIFCTPTEGSTYEEEGIYNEGNVYESDSAFYRQSEGLLSGPIVTFVCLWEISKKITHFLYYMGLENVQL